MNEAPEGTRDQSPEERERLVPPAAVSLVNGDAVPGLGSWVLERKIGGGGFGEVWLARHALNANLPPRAVKFCTDPDARHRLVTHEKNVVARVMKCAGEHPNIVPLLEYNLDGDVPWLMYEYVEGGTLVALADRWRELPTAKRVGRAVRVLHQIAGALVAMHRLTPPIVHRDLKPANVLMAGAVPRLADFGIGSVALPDVPDDQTGAFTAAAAQIPSALRGAGTRLYAPPEQMLGAPPDPREDVYALGVIAYQLATGFSRAAPGTDAPAELRELEVPIELADLIVRSVAVNPERRPRDAGEWQAVLGAVLSRATLQPTPTDTGSPSAPQIVPPAAPSSGTETDLTGVPFVPPVGHPRRVLPALALGALVVAVLFAYIGSQHPHDQANGDAVPPAPKGDAGPKPVPKVTAFPANPKPGQEFELEIAPNVKMRFCYVPAGECQLGSPDDEIRELLQQPLQQNERVEVATETEAARGKYATTGFWFGKYEVTQAEWAAVMRGTLIEFPSWCSPNGQGSGALGAIRDTGRFPVDSVSWVDCQEFLRRATAYRRATGGAEVLDMPHEDDWEYACRGGLGNGRAFHFGGSLNGKLANCDGRFPFGTDEEGAALMRTTPAGTYEALAPHPWGLCDMHGSVWEWCKNLYQDARRPRAVRGGSWGTAAWSCRSARRGWYEPAARGTLGGLRVLATTPQPPAP